MTHLRRASLALFSLFSLVLILNLNACNKSPSSSPTGQGAQSCSQAPIQSITADGMEASCIGDLVELEGTLTVYATKDEQSSSFHYILEDAQGVKHLLQFNGNPGYQSGAHIKVSGFHNLCMSVTAAAEPPGLVFADPVVVGGAPADGPQLSQFSNTIGAQPLLAILVNFSDTSNPYSLSDVQNVVFNQVDGFWKEMSFGKTWITGKAVGPFQIKMSSAFCDTNAIASSAKSAALAAGENISQYSRYVYIYPKNAACGSWLGMGTVGGNPSQTWINGALQMHTLAHEMGHNLGLYHANGLNCGSTTLGSSCSSVEYADPSDAMGNRVAGQYTAYQKEQLGWIGAQGTPGVTLVRSSGTYGLEPYETNTGNPKALKILKTSSGISGNTYYYIEYRQPLGYDGVFSSLGVANNLTRGVLIHTGSDADANSSLLLNMNASTGSWYESALNPGQTFHDSASGLAIKLNSADSNQAVVSVSLGNVNPPQPTPTPPPPANAAIGLKASASSYHRGDLVKLQISGSHLALSGYALRITGPGNVSFTKTGTLDANGSATEQVQMTSCAPSGTYMGTVSVSGGDSVNSSSQFQVE